MQSLACQTTNGPSPELTSLDSDSDARMLLSKQVIHLCGDKMIAPDNFVDLGRTFHELSSQEAKTDDFDYSQAFWVRNKLTWADVLRENRVIILSEAGSGKTTEIRNAAEALRSKNNFAFFLRLENAIDSIDHAFEVGTLDEYNTWISGNQEAWLFLDSVDEARLRHPSDFEKALRQIGLSCSSGKCRVRVFITSRASAWRAKTDFALTSTVFPPLQNDQVVEESDSQAGDQNRKQPDAARTKSKDDTKTPGFRVVALDSLNESQVRTFASARGISESTAFMDAIERADAWSYTTRPQDLIELVEFWQQYGKLGTRLEILQNSIDRRIIEREQNRDEANPLSKDEAALGARYIAAACTFSKTQTIKVPDGIESGEGLIVRTVLPKWDSPKISTLLSRPIFDEAIYGSIRFHTRDVREYLTAEWLANLLQKPASRRKVEAVLFKNQYGRPVVIPTARPILPWLSILDPKIAEKVAAIAPEVFFEGGDPCQIPLPLRKRILADTCDQIARGVSSRWTFDQKALQRFSAPDLQDEIKKLLVKHQDNDELTGFFMKMIWLGRLSDCLELAKQVALAKTHSKYTRIAAIRAVGALTKPTEFAELRAKIAIEAKFIDREIFAEFVDSIERGDAAIKWLKQNFVKAKRIERFSVDNLKISSEQFARDLRADDLPTLISSLRSLLNTKPFIERRFCEVSKEFSWLLSTAAIALDRLIDAQHPFMLSQDALDLLSKLQFADSYQVDDIQGVKVNLGNKVKLWKELNYALFWSAIEQERERARAKNEKPVTEYWQISWMWNFYGFSAEDFAYVLDQIAAQNVSDNRLVALSLAYALYRDNARPKTWLARLKKSASSDEALKSALHRHLHPAPASKEAKRFRRDDARWKKQTKIREQKREANRADWKAHLSSNIDKIRNPGFPEPQMSNAQCYLHDRMKSANGSSNRWTDGNWLSLIPEFGKDIASAFRDGAVNFWRTFNPKLVSEGAAENSTPWNVIFGLTGILIESRETTSWPNQLTPDEVSLAARYAVFELNGFPAWFPNLSLSHQNIVCEVLWREIEFELTSEYEKVERHYVLDDISWSGDWSWAWMAPKFLSWLKENDPKKPATLDKLLKVIQSSEVSNTQLGELASIKTGSVDNHEQLSAWFALWAGVDPDRAISSFRDAVAKINDVLEQARFVMNFVTKLSGESRFAMAYSRSAFKQPRYLKDLYLIVHEYVRQAEDVDRSGKGVYSPELRDYAQRAREALFNLLKEIPGKGAYLALIEISEKHPEAHARPWFEYHAKKRAESDSDIEAWNANQVIEYGEQLERTPSTHRELAELARLRLMDLKDDLENGDSSIAETIRKVSQETEMRKFIGHELRNRSYNRYSVVQEEELADGKRIDLRFFGVGFDAPVPAELKLADKWTGPELFERLENQLCGDYLRDPRSTRGLFVLVNRKQGGWGIPGASGRVGFSELVTALEERWLAISGELNRTGIAGG